MRLETTETSIKLVEQRDSDGLWAVRWDFKPKLDENGNETGIYWYEEEAFNWIPSIEDIQKTIVEWFNKQTDAMIQDGFTWKGKRVLLSDENKFNFSMFTIEADRRESEIKEWDLQHPEIAGHDVVEREYIDESGKVKTIQEPTGRPVTRLPITFKLSRGNDLDSFYTFTSVKELKNFTSASTDHLQGSYGAGWYKIATFDWMPYVQALQEIS